MLRWYACSARCSSSSAAACSCLPREPALKPLPRFSLRGARALDPEPIAVVGPFRKSDPLPVPLRCLDDVIHSAPKRDGRHSRQHRIDPAVEHRVRDQHSGQRRKQDAVPKMRGRVQEIRQHDGCADHRQLVRRRRPQAHARAQKTDRRCVRHELARGLQKIANASDRGPLVEVGFLHRRADEHGTVVPRHEITMIGPGGAAQRRACPGEVQQLTANRAERALAGSRPRHRRRSTSFRRRARPRHTSSGRDRFRRRDPDPSRNTRSTRLFSTSCTPWRLAAAASPRVRSPAATKPCDGIEQAADDVVRKVRFLRPRTGAVDDVRRNTEARERVRGRTQFPRLPARPSRRSVFRCRRYGTAMPPSATMRAMKSSYSLEAANSEAEQRALGLRLDERRKQTGRRLRRAHPGSPIVDNFHRRAASSQLIGDGAADDAGADDDDVARGRHARAS